MEPTDISKSKYIALKHMGPGLLYAAAAIGVSHVVQSTRAGAQFGYSLLWAIVLANVFKYPFFKVGPLYTTLTGKSLLAGYRGLGKWAMPLFFALTLSTMFVVVAAITSVTAGLAQYIFGSSLDVPTYGLVLLGTSAAILALGRYNILDNFIKIIVIALTLTTIISAIIGLATPIDKPLSGLGFSFTDNNHLFFLAALIGWMPAPMDVPIWHSVWTLAKQKESSDKITVKESLRDFKIGYIGTAVLALFFLALGAMVMHGSGEQFKDGAGAFAGQFIELYGLALGSWARPFIAIAAFSTMFSTCLACLDAFARITQEGTYQWSQNEKFKSKTWYFFWLQLIFFGSLAIIFFSMTNMRTLVDFATTLSFLIAPLLAWMNFKVMQGRDVPDDYHFKGAEKAFCYLGMLLFSAFALYYLYLRFNGN